jgi:hypothetical protein
MTTRSVAELDDRGLAALAEAIHATLDEAYCLTRDGEHDMVPQWWDLHAAAILGEHGRFIEDGREVDPHSVDFGDGSFALHIGADGHAVIVEAGPGAGDIADFRAWLASLAALSGGEQD